MNLASLVKQAVAQGLVTPEPAGTTYSDLGSERDCVWRIKVNNMVEFGIIHTHESVEGKWKRAIRDYPGNHIQLFEARTGEGWSHEQLVRDFYA